MSKNTWQHRDMLRLAHPKGLNSDIANFILNGAVSNSSPAIIQGFKKMQAATTQAAVLKVLDEFPSLPWEAIPSEFLKSPKVWASLFYAGQLNGQALVRNVTRLSRIGAFDDMKFAGDYASRLGDTNMIARTRLHPISFLNALVVHKDGQIERNTCSGCRNKSWKTAPVIADALEAGFYAAFKNIRPANKATLLAVDVSGSMSQSAIGLDLSCAQVSAAMAMVIARSEPSYNIVGFSHNIVDLGITAKTSLPDAMRAVRRHNFGMTDASAAIEYATQKRVGAETFVVITDNETWAGLIHPFQAIKKYRQATGINARLAVLGVASNGFTIADPSDAGMMDFAGFDSATPQLVSEFSAGRL